MEFVLASHKFLDVSDFAVLFSLVFLNVRTSDSFLWRKIATESFILMSLCVIFKHESFFTICWNLEKLLRTDKELGREINYVKFFFF